MSTDIRLASGALTAFDFLADSTNLVTNFPTQSDQQIAYKWFARQPDKALQSTFRSGLEIGSGKIVGKFAGIIEFDVLTIEMRQYINTTIMSSKPSALVTMYLSHPVNGFGVYQGELIDPFSVNSDLAYERFADDQYNNVQYQFKRAVLVVTSELLLESGDFLLLESGDKLLLEQQ